MIGALKTIDETIDRILPIFCRNCCDGAEPLEGTAEQVPPRQSQAAGLAQGKTDRAVVR